MMLVRRLKDGGLMMVVKVGGCRMVNDGFKKVEGQLTDDGGESRWLKDGV